MIIGYPGRTSRFMTSAEVAYRRDVGNKIRIGAREVRQDRMMEVMLTDPAIRLEYASKHASLSNFWKKSKGMNETFARLNVEQRRAEAEQQFIEWVNRDPKRIAKYGDALDLINNSVNKNKEEMYDALLYGETLRTIELTGFANGARLIERALKVGGEEELEKAKKKYLGLIEKRMEGFYVELDRNVAKGVIKVYDEMRKREGRPAFYTTIREEFGGDIDKFVDHLYDNTIYTDIDKIKDAVENDVDKLFSDPLMDIANSLFEYTREYMAMATRAPDEDYAKGHKAYIAGQLEMRKGEALYPDANSTMRMTYGQVLDYSPRDAVHYHYVTTLDGVMEKEDADNWEFIIPEKLKELHRARDYGSYTDKDGNMPVCFISNNDITGGNSGSPVLNGKGELIGCAFDGNWEAMSGDVIFEPTYQRCINVDVRYILFLIEKYGNAKHLIDEMTIVN